MKTTILNKCLDDIDNHDLAMVGLPDSVGSFLMAYLEDVLKLKWDEVKKSMTLQDFVDLKNKHEAPIVIQVISNDYAIDMVVRSPSKRKVLFITDEGISFPSSVEDLKYCLEVADFKGCLLVKRDALTLAEDILKTSNLPEYFIKYLEERIEQWN